MFVLRLVRVANPGQQRRSFASSALQNAKMSDTTGLSQKPFASAGFCTRGDVFHRRLFAKHGCAVGVEDFHAGDVEAFHRCRMQPVRAGKWRERAKDSVACALG
ncbi:hypothetical protein D9M70_568790 [compost metagenome]